MLHAGSRTARSLEHDAVGPVREDPHKPSENYEGEDDGQKCPLWISRILGGESHAPHDAIVRHRTRLRKDARRQSKGRQFSRPRLGRTAGVVAPLAKPFVAPESYVQDLLLSAQHCVKPQAEPDMPREACRLQRFVRRRWLGCSAHGSLNGLRQLDSHKPLRGKKVVLATLVDDADLARGFRVGIGEGDVDLVSFEGYLVAIVIDAHDEACAPWKSRGRAARRVTRRCACA
jgi:hypothetical protein